MILPSIISVQGRILKRIYGCNYTLGNAHIPIGVYLDCHGNKELESNLKDLIDTDFLTLFTFPLGLLLIAAILLFISWLQRQQ